MDLSPTYAANIGVLPAGTRRALDTETDIAVYLNRGIESAAVCLPDGRLLPLHGSADPVAAAGTLLDRIGDAPVIAVVGIGLGYVVDAIERRGASTKVLALEPIPAIARAMLARRDWRDPLTSGRLALLVGPGYPDAPAAFRLFGRDVAAPPLLASPLVEREFPTAAAAAQGVIARIVAGARANAAARRKFAGRYLLNTLRNIPAVAREGDAAALDNAFTGIPAIVVAAGPTLDANLPALRRLQTSALIVAVDTAVRPLLAAGVRPHLAVSVDPSEVNALHLRDLPDADAIALLAEGSIDPSVFPTFAGRTFTFRVSQHSPWPWLRAHAADRGALQAWGSVLTTAFDAAIRAGCDPIVFAGADLAYSRGLQYCRNTAFEPRWQHLTTDAERADAFKSYLAERPHVTHPDVHGVPTITTRDFLQFRDWIVSRAAGVRPRRVMNATGAGTLHGASIEQATIEALAFPALSGGTVSGRLVGAWESGLAERARAKRALAASLDTRAALPLADWLEFGGDTATADQILGAVTYAAAGLQPADSRAPEDVGRTDRDRFRHPAIITRAPAVSWDDGGMTGAVSPLEAFRNRHRGERCFLIGNGPSLGQLDLTKLRGEAAFIVGRGYLAAQLGLPDVPYYALSDPTTYRAHAAEIRRAHVGTRFYRSDVMDTPEYADAPDREAAIRVPFHMAPTMEEGAFAEDPVTGVHRGFTVIGDVAQLAFMMGFAEVFVIGCDLDFDSDAAFFYDAPAAGLARATVMPVARVRRAMAVAAERFQRDGRTFANAGRGGRLDTIPRVDFDSLF